jgi:hypothetical protein
LAFPARIATATSRSRMASSRCWQGHASRHRFVDPDQKTRAGDLLHGLADSVFNTVWDARRRKENIQGAVGGDEDSPFVVYRIPCWPEELHWNQSCPNVSLEERCNFIVLLNLSKISTCNDFIFYPRFSGHLKPEQANVPRKICFRTDYGSRSVATFSNLCQPLSRRPQR